MNSGDQNSTAPTTIAFVGFGSFSHTNASLAEALRRSFSGHQLDCIDVGRLLKERKLMPPATWGHAILEFAPDVGLSPWQLKRRLPWTTYAFRQRSQAAAKQMSRRRYLFSIQTQSIFDASVPGLPHFVYTDNTMLANRQYQNPSLLFVKGMILKNNLPVTEKWIARERRLYHNACACFTMSRNVARSLIDDYGCPRDKVVLAYVGCNVPVKVSAQKKYDQKNILFVGVDWEGKGGPELLRAFRLLRAQISDATLTVVGCSPLIQQPGCQVVGRISPHELSQYYSKASVFCLPTRHEAFGIAVLEAMAHELPIVATNVAAIPEMVTNGENGFLVPPGDAQKLAEALIRLASNPVLCQQMGQLSHAVSQNYSWDNVAHLMRGVIQGFVPTLSVGGSSSVALPSAQAGGPTC
jgi:glycosyltransferase involved in cell wall biosynthesis